MEPQFQESPIAEFFSVLLGGLKSGVRVLLLQEGPLASRKVRLNKTEKSRTMSSALVTKNMLCGAGLFLGGK